MGSRLRIASAPGNEAVAVAGQCGTTGIRASSVIRLAWCAACCTAAYALLAESSVTSPRSFSRASANDGLSEGSADLQQKHDASAWHLDVLPSLSRSRSEPVPFSHALTWLETCLWQGLSPFRRPSALKHEHLEAMHTLRELDGRRGPHQHLVRRSTQPAGRPSGTAGRQPVMTLQITYTRKTGIIVHQIMA